MMTNGADSIRTDTSTFDFAADLDELDKEMRREDSYQSTDSINISMARLSSKNTIRPRPDEATAQFIDNSRILDENPSILGWAQSSSLSNPENSTDTLSGSLSYLTESGGQVTYDSLASSNSRLIFLTSSYSNSVFSEIQHLDAYRAKNPGELLYIVASETEEAFICRFVELPLTMAVIFDPKGKLSQAVGQLKPMITYNSAVVPRKRRVRFSEKDEIVPQKEFKKSIVSGLGGMFRRFLGL